jgi:hypothetical protein
VEKVVVDHHDQVEVVVHLYLMVVVVAEVEEVRNHSLTVEVEEEVVVHHYD